MFGDSLSDNGNGIKKLYNEWPYSPPYFDGRFSNGPIWIEYFPTPSLLNYAYGGSALNQTLVIYAPSISTQINDYLISTQFRVPKDTQYIIWAGANDVFWMTSNDTLLNNETVGPLNNLQSSLPELLMLNVKRLLDAGAEDILIMGIPNLSIFPGFSETLSSEQSTTLVQLLISINNEFLTNLLAWPMDVNKVNLNFFPTLDLFDAIFDDPQRYCLSNVTSPCLENWQNFGQRGAVGEGIPKICQEPTKYFFWDAWHPTARTHSIIADEVMKFLNWPAQKYPSIST